MKPENKTIVEETNDSIVILNCGNQTPVGHRSAITATSVRCKIARKSLHPVFEDSHWEPIRLGIAEYLDDTLNNHEQFKDLAISALKEALLPLESLTSTPVEVPVIIGLPEPRPGLSPHIDIVLERALMELGKPVDTNLIFSFIPQGHTSGLLAMIQAQKVLKNHEFCVIGGVETYLEATTLEWLELKKKRLLCSTNRDGFIPGQAAGFCLLSTERTLQKYDLPWLAKVLSVASGEEENEFDSDKNSTGKGLSQAMREVLKNLPEDKKVDQVYCSLNGESYHTLEYAYAMINNGDRIRDANDYVAPFNSWGDIGAAIVPVLISLAAEAGRKDYAKGPINLITSASLGNSRACALLELPVTQKSES